MQPRACNQTDWGRQFGEPTGWRGRALGRLMALKNARMSRVAVELLDVQPDDRGLEIGFGPGVAIAEAGRQVVACVVFKDGVTLPRHPFDVQTLGEDQNTNWNCPNISSSSLPETPSRFSD